MLLATVLGSGSAIHFLVGFIVVICVIAVVIIAAKWLISLTGLPIPQPLLVILGILLFLVLLLWLFNWSGVYTF